MTAQVSARVVQVRSGRPFRNPQQGPDLRVFESFHVMEHDDGPLPRTQRVQGTGQACAQFVRFRRIAMRGRQRLRQLIGVPHLAAAGDVERRIGHDPVQPRAEGLLRTEAVERAEGVQKPFLNGVFRVVMRQHDGPCDGIRTPLVPPDQVVRELSNGISMVIEMMMAKDPRERYHSTEHLIEDLDLVAAGESPVHARPKLDAPGGGVAAIEGPQDSDLQIASVPRGPGLLSTPVGIAVAALLALSLAANAVMLLLMLRR